MSDAPIIPLWRQLENRRDLYLQMAALSRDAEREHYLRVVGRIDRDLAYVRVAYRDLDIWLTGVIVGHLRYPSSQRG